MRKAFAEALFKEMETDPTIYLITADLGYGLFDRIREYFPNRFFNVQAAEQAMLGTAIGITLQGKTAICYSITPFLIYRPFEWIKLYLEGEGIPVKLVGSGLDDDYKKDGLSHFAFDTDKLLDLMPNIMQLNPKDYANMEVCVHHMLHNNKPTFLGLRR